MGNGLAAHPPPTEGARVFGVSAARQERITVLGGVAQQSNFRDYLGITIFITYLVPPIVLSLPLARVVGTLGLFDSWWALVLVYPTFTIPFCTWLLMGFFKSIPPDLEEAAWVDGCGTLGGIVHVIVPLSRPGIMIAAISSFTLSLHEVLYAIVYVGPRERSSSTTSSGALRAPR